MGVSFSEYGAYYCGGVGMSCYYNIAKFIGAKLTHTAFGNTFDQYDITFN